MDFIGRRQELEQLSGLIKRDHSSLVVIKGRRRIGKSTLAVEFSKKFNQFFRFEGLAPRQGQTAEDQLGEFAKQLQKQFAIPKVSFSDWGEAFTFLASQLTNQKTLILFDEISWMSQGDLDFAGKLKIAWDQAFSPKKSLILILCSSVSSWIEKNILHHTNFIGRISLVIRLQELKLSEAAQFWGKRAKVVGTKEILSILAVTGGIPKYLTEIEPRSSANQNIERLCFTSGGYLFEDFERIFSDIFGRRAQIYRKIVSQLAEKSLTATGIATKLKIGLNGDLLDYLDDLKQSGFISEQRNYLPNGRRARIRSYKLQDNYLRFYLKYISPNSDAIKSGLFKFSSLSALVNWDTILGLQVENLILSRIPEVINALGLASERIISAAPYIQRKTNKVQPCQIDLLLTSRSGVYYVIEIKSGNLVEINAVKEVQAKIEKLKFTKKSVFRPVLIHSGELSSGVLSADYFDIILNIESLLRGG